MELKEFKDLDESQRQKVIHFFAIDAAQRNKGVIDSKNIDEAEIEARDEIFAVEEHAIFHLEKVLIDYNNQQLNNARTRNNTMQTDGSSTETPQKTEWVKVKAMTEIIQNLQTTIDRQQQLIEFLQNYSARSETERATILSKYSNLVTNS